MIILNPDELKDMSYENRGVYEGTVHFSKNDRRRKTMLYMIEKLEEKKKLSDEERKHFLSYDERRKIYYCSSDLTLDEMSKIYGSIKTYKEEDKTPVPKIII